MMRNRPVFWSALSVSILVFFINDAYAAVDPNNTLDTIVRLYRDRAAAWEGALKSFALRLFWLLALIEFAWAAIRLALKGADFSEWTAEIVMQVLFIGFFLTLLLNSSAWAGAVVDSFREAANAASASAGGTSGITPSNIFDVGVQLGNKVMDTASFWGAPVDSLGLMISALVIIVCFALIAAFMILALVEAYIVISAGVLLMGFGGSRWTKDYAVKIIVYAVSVGAKLFVLQLLVGLGESMINSWVSNFETNNTDIFVMVGSAIVMLALVKIVPEMVQSLINGTSVSSGSALLGATATVGGAAATVATNTVGVGVATGAAAKLASSQVAASIESGSGPASTAGRYAALTGRTAQNLGSAAWEDMGRRLSGRPQGGAMTWRMADSLNQKTKDLEAERNKPALPSPGSTGGSAGANTSMSGGSNSPTGGGPGGGSSPSSGGSSGGGSAPPSAGGSSTGSGPVPASTSSSAASPASGSSASGSSGGTVSNASASAGSGSTPPVNPGVSSPSSSASNTTNTSSAASGGSLGTQSTGAIGGTHGGNNPAGAANPSRAGGAPNTGPVNSGSGNPPASTGGNVIRPANSPPPKP